MDNADAWAYGVCETCWVEWRRDLCDGCSTKIPRDTELCDTCRRKQLIESYLAGGMCELFCDAYSS